MKIKAIFVIIVAYVAFIIYVNIYKQTSVFSIPAFKFKIRNFKEDKKNQYDLTKIKAEIKKNYEDELSIKIIEGAVTQRDLIELFSQYGEEYISNKILMLWRYENNSSIKEMLISVWEMDRGNYPGFNWNEIDSDNVKLSLANVLYKLTKNSKYLDFIKGKATSEDNTIRLKANSLIRQHKNNWGH